MRIGSLIVIVLSLIATAFSVAVTAVGWERILFYTGWMSSSFVYPASILLYILLFGLAMMRCRTITRAAGASLIASIAALLVWVFISAVDQYYGGPLVAMMTGWFDMQSIIVEETSLNIIAVLGGVLWPLLSPSSSPPSLRSAGCRGTSSSRSLAYLWKAAGSKIRRLFSWQPSSSTSIRR